jgi:phosphopantothenoylcysteine decarboxylase/phosphopantothenate--cysteine ligase
VKKQDGDASIELERTKDILFELGQKKTKQILVGFAAETDYIDEYAKRKLQKKNADMIVANNVSQEGAGFGTETNIVTIYKKDGNSESLPLMSKQKVAEKIINEVSLLIKDMSEYEDRECNC